jgi:hypothetical protein
MGAGRVEEQVSSSTLNFVLRDPNDAADRIDVLEAAQGYATRLLEHFVAEHFPPNPDWKPLPDLIGVLTQLDNALTIARDYKARIEALEAALRDNETRWLAVHDLLGGVLEGQLFRALQDAVYICRTRNVAALAPEQDT